VTLDEINGVSSTEADAAFMSCCGSSRWAGWMTGARPFESADELFAMADTMWRRTEAPDWHEAFSHHPRIGERSTGWAAGEQSAVGTAGERARAELADVNRTYEEKFGHIYIVCATGKSAEEMLALAKIRMGNDPVTELQVAADEQRKIMQLRLRKLLGETT
jgi:OHCU decarboxylase